jgi:hypothetical protein
MNLPPRWVLLSGRTQLFRCKKIQPNKAFLAAVHISSAHGAMYPLIPAHLEELLEITHLLNVLLLVLVDAQLLTFLQDLLIEIAYVYKLQISQTYLSTKAIFTNLKT